MANPVSPARLLVFGVTAAAMTLGYQKLVVGRDWSWWLVFTPYLLLIACLTLVVVIRNVRDARRRARELATDAPPDSEA